MPSVPAVGAAVLSSRITPACRAAGHLSSRGDYIGRLFVSYTAVIVAFALTMFAYAGRCPHQTAAAMC